jgi:hypothetical protein
MGAMRLHILHHILEGLGALDEIGVPYDRLKYDCVSYTTAI